MTLFNIYCDESCHLEHDNHPIMLLGGIWCKEDRIKKISQEIRDIKERFNTRGEIKWTKVSPSRIEFFRNLIDYFFTDDSLHFRSLVVANKSKLNHDYFNQGSHDTFYYKMYYQLLSPILDPIPETPMTFNIYLDIKDTRSQKKVEKLHEVLCNKFKDHCKQRILKIQQIRSEESELLQLADLLMGAVGYHNRQLGTSSAKIKLIDYLRTTSNESLSFTTALYKKKFNLFFFRPQEFHNA